MKLQDICVSLELAKELKEAGYDQRGNLFYYMNAPDKYTKSNMSSLTYGLEGWFGENLKPFVLGQAGHVGLANCNKYYAAPTVAELGEALPVLTGSMKTFHGNHYTCNIHENCPIFKDLPLKPEVVDGEEMLFYLKSTGDKSEANARAKMWLYLKKNRLLTN